MNINLEKYLSVGEKYIVIDANDIEYKQVPEYASKLGLEYKACGVSGIIFGPYFESYGTLFEIYDEQGCKKNNRGSDLIAIGRFLKDRGYVQKKDYEVLIDERKHSIRYNNEIGSSITVTTDKIEFSPEEVGFMAKNPPDSMQDIPLRFDKFSYICTCCKYQEGVHCVLPYRLVNKDIVCEMGKRIMASGYFGKMPDTEIVQIVDRQNIKVEIYTNDIGYKAISAYNACAAAGAMYKAGYIGSKVSVNMPQGTINVSINHDFIPEVTGHIEKI